VIVVSDTSPLAYLVEVGIVECLPTLYEQIYVPPAVADELRRPGCPAAEWMSSPPDWLQVLAPQRQLAGHDLDAGELEAIALALEIGCPQLLMDERAGRSVAESLGLHVAGTLAVIVASAKMRLCDGDEVLDRLEQTSFHASPELMQSVRTMLQS
jgi:predicted nucleic acid-binding protein